MRIVPSTLAAVAALALCATPVLAAHPNLFVNGHLDTDMTGWAGEGNDGAGGYRATTGGGPGFSGNPSGFFIINAAGASGSDPALAQTVTGLTPGASYVISGDRAWSHSCCGSPTALSFGVKVDGTTVLNVNRVGMPQGEWFPFSVQFTATSDTHTIRFLSEMNGDDSSYGVDNLSLNTAAGPAVPELAGMWFAAIGLAALGGVFIARRRA